MEQSSPKVNTISIYVKYQPWLGFDTTQWHSAVVVKFIPKVSVMRYDNTGIPVETTGLHQNSKRYYAN